MSWLIKQAEDILNRVDQQTNAAFQQPKSQSHSHPSHIDFVSDTRPTSASPTPFHPPNLNHTTFSRPIEPRRTKKAEEADLINYLNHSTPLDRHESKTDTIASRPVQATRRISHSDKDQYERQLQSYQQQISQSDALLHDLRTREVDLTAVLAAKDSQLAVLRGRLVEAEQLQHRCSDSSETAVDLHDDDDERAATQVRLKQLEQRVQDNERRLDENNSAEKQLRAQLSEERQHTKHAKSMISQLEQEMSEYKAKAQRILQAKDKLIVKLKDMAQHRSSTPTTGEQQVELEADNSILLDMSRVGDAGVSSHWLAAQYEEVKSENLLFKQELQARELTIQSLRNEVHEVELQMQHADEQLHAQTHRFDGQLKDERARAALIEQDYRRLKEELTSMADECLKQKQTHQTQCVERERDLERLRVQLTGKAINHVNDSELEKRLQALTESILHKQTIIEALQTEKSGLKMQLERVEKRLDDYETLTRMPPPPLPTSIVLDEHEQYENLRYRQPLLRETLYDANLAKKVKRAANELDRLGIRLMIFLRHYPVVRLGVLLYAIVLHLWTFVFLFIHAPSVQ